MHHAFYLDCRQWPTPHGDTCACVGAMCHVTGQEAQHMAYVLRLREGDAVLLFDGEGRQALCCIVALHKREVRVRLESVEYVPQPSALSIMALALSKATRRGFFMEKAVELGVHEVWLWQGDHSQGKVPAHVKEHWHAQCVAAMKQSKNPWLPSIRVLTGGVSELVERSATCDYKFVPWEVQGEELPMLTAEMAGQVGTSVYTIGPEGGFSVREIDILKAAAFMPVSLGKRVLRCETAALLCLGIHWWSSEHKASVTKMYEHE